ncbi:MAG: peptidyl-prolyl cis-trans isomerase B (cyclophilin B) [Hyphomicrobiaceae bacterium]
MIQVGPRTTHPFATLALSAVCLLAVSCSSPAEDGATSQPAAPAPAVVVDNGKTVVVITTNRGVIKAELDSERAPVSVENFLEYAKAGHYEGTVFHRVIKGFMIQGGGFNADTSQKPTRDPIKNEADNQLKNDRGTLAMARTSVVDSATAQFFINHADNAFLNFKAPTTQGYGYTVFGRVIEGMNVVDDIANSKTENKGGAFRDAPIEPVTIQSVELVGD